MKIVVKVRRMSYLSSEKSDIFQDCERTTGRTAKIESTQCSVVPYGTVHVQYGMFEDGFEIFDHGQDQNTMMRLPD